MIEMNLKVSECLNQMMRVLGYDPEQKTFYFSNDEGNPMNREYSVHLDVSRVIRFIDEVDHSGVVALHYLYNLCEREMKGTKVTVFEILENPHLLDKFRELKSLMESDTMRGCLDILKNSLERIIAISSPQKLIGDDSSVERDIFSSIDKVVEDFMKLKMEVYRRSGAPIGEIKKISSKISVFNSLAECVLALESSDDGLYICYISNPGTLDGYFGFYIRSNGNIFSINERIDEAYIGQHAKFRNGRYAEQEKALNLFPYDEMCKFSGEDYKGYPTGIEIDSRKLDIFDISKVGRGVCIRILICIALIEQEYLGTVLDKEEVLIDSLLPQNLRQIGGGSKSLVKYEKSAIVRSSSDFKIEFDKEKLLAGEYNPVYDRNKEGGLDEEKGNFSGFNQELVDSYGQDFEFDNDSLIRSDSSRRLIGESSANQEFIGTRKRLELSAYYHLRKKLAQHIETEMNSEYEKFGGWSGLQDWYKEKLDSVRDKIYDDCVKCYLNLEKTRENGTPRSRYELEPQEEIRNLWNREMICPAYVVIKDSSEKEFFSGIFLLCLNEFDEKRQERVCPITGKSVWWRFEFHFMNSKAVERYLGTSLPKFCTGWTYYNETYEGNSILDVTDPVADITHPLKKSGQTYNFSFSINLSRSGLKKLLKERNG